MVDVLKKLCASENTCHKLICKDSVTSALLSPLAVWLHKAVSVERSRNRGSF